MIRAHLQKLAGESGIALVLALGVLVSLTAATVLVVDYSTQNSGASAVSKERQKAFSLAEAGLNNIFSVLNNPSNNALLASTLPSCSTAQSNWRHSKYDAGTLVIAGSPTPDLRATVDWCGDLDAAAAAWTVKAIATVRNPTGATAVRKTLTAYVTVTPTVSQPLNNPAWNYIYAKQTGQPCDMTLSNNISGSSRLYVAGSLCLNNNVTITQTGLIVQGNLDLSNNAAVGSNASMATRVETFVGGQCRYGVGEWAYPCSGNQDSRRIYSKMNSSSWAVGVSNAPPVIAAPVSDFATWYANAIPGPAQACTTSSGTPPTFDNDTTRNNSVSTVFELTPAFSYTCRVGPVGSPSGEISWNASTRVLTVSGTIFIDGSLQATNMMLNQYNGQATIYLSGTYYQGNGTKLCGGVSGSSCDFANWNPNTEMLTITTEGSGGLAGTGNGILIDNNGEYQGALYAQANVAFSNNSRSDGPIVGNTMVFSNNVQNDQFPTITVVPVGMPGNPAVYAQPNPPQKFSG